jgi:thioredoxin 1
MVAYVTQLNSENFKTFTENEFSLVDVWAPWCGPCKLIAPMIDQISSEYVGQLSVGKLNADDNTDLVKELGIRNIPTLLFYKNGELITDSEGNAVKLVGNVKKETLKEVIEEHLS